MPRQWTRRRLAPLNGAALDPVAFAQAYPLFRACSTDPAAANKEALGLLLAFACLALPFHLVMKCLAAYSPVLAAGVGGAVAVGLLAVALARRLGQDELLRKLPLVLLAVLAAYGLHLLTAVRKDQMGWGGVEWVGLFLLVSTAASVAASFYQPASAAYRTVTQGTPVPTLVTAAAMTALSTGLAVMGQAIPWFVQQAVGCVAAFGYAGLVLFEYAAWVKADPALDLSAQLAAVAAARTEYEREKHTLTARQGRRFVSEAMQAGGLFALFLLGGDGFLRPDSELPQLLATIEPDKAQENRELLLGLCLVGGLWFLIEVFSASGTLCKERTMEGLPSLLLGWKPLVVFLTYPDTRHPLAHRLRFQWLRPKAVRLGLTAAVLLLIPSVNSRPAAATPQVVTHSPASIVVASPPAARSHPGDAELDRICGVTPDAWARGEQPPASVFAPAPPIPLAAGAGPSDSAPPPFPVILFFAVVGPPAVVYSVVAALGVFILPTYRAIANDAQTPTS